MQAFNWTKIDFQEEGVMNAISQANINFTMVNKIPLYWKSVQENKCVSVTTNYFSNNVLLSLMPLTLLDCNILTRFQPSMALEILLDDTNTFLSYLFYFSFKSHTHTDYSAFSVFVDITIFSSSKDNGC